MTILTKDNIRVTMKDVARHAGVSQSTVSFVLSGVTDVSITEETKVRVIQSAKTLNYRTRAKGGAAKSPSTPIIGFMVDEIATSPWAAITIEGAQETAWRNGHILEVAMTGEDRAYEQVVLDKWLDKGKEVTGVIYCSILTRLVSPPKKLKDIRSILVNCYSEETSYTSIVPAEIMGGFTGTKALIQKGHKRIAFISGEMWMEAARDRLTGYRNALTTFDLPVDDDLIREGNFMPSGGYQQTIALLKSKKRPDAIFCSNDLTAIGCYEALKENGVRIPEDIAVMGYDDEEICQHLTPKLSSVMLPHREMGQWAVDHLISPSSDATNIFKLECPLVVRESI